MSYKACSCHAVRCRARPQRVRIFGQRGGGGDEGEGEGGRTGKGCICKSIHPFLFSFSFKSGKQESRKNRCTLITWPTLKSKNKIAKKPKRGRDNTKKARHSWSMLALIITVVTPFSSSLLHFSVDSVTWHHVLVRIVANCVLSDK